MLLGCTYNKECTQHLQAMDIHNLLSEETMSQNDIPPCVAKMKNTKKCKSFKYTDTKVFLHISAYSDLLFLGITGKL